MKSIMKRTQKEKILEWLKSGKSITAMGALGQFGCYRLASRINDLRNDGYEIRCEMIKVGAIEGNAWVAKYVLDKTNAI